MFYMQRTNRLQLQLMQYEDDNTFFNLVFTNLGLKTWLSRAGGRALMAYTPELSSGRKEKKIKLLIDNNINHIIIQLE